MEIPKSQIDNLIEDALSKIDNDDVRNEIIQWLVEPRCENREWDYGEVDQTYPCWIILEHRKSNIAIAYCANGFGPSYPWGLLFISGNNLSMGMDSGWFSTLESAFFESGIWDGEMPENYEIP